jgi:hypothetical protein
MISSSELVLDAGGNVGVTLVRFLAWAGAERFVLVGQDLAWQGEKTHVAGHHSAAYTFKYNPSEDVRLKNLHGQDIYTHLGFLAAKRDLEKDIAGTKLPFYNLYGDGAVIEGAVNIDLDTLRNQDLVASTGAAKEVFLGALSQAARPRMRPIFTPRSPDWAVSLKNAGRRLEKLTRKAAKHQGEIRSCSNSFLFPQAGPVIPALYLQRDHGRGRSSTPDPTMVSRNWRSSRGSGSGCSKKPGRSTQPWDRPGPGRPRAKPAPVRASPPRGCQASPG